MAGKATYQASESQSVNTSAFLVTYLVRLPTRDFWPLFFLKAVPEVKDL
jgi:hypothetical protein